MELTTGIDLLPSVGPAFKRRLEKLVIFTINDLLFHFPFRYEDYSIRAKIATLQPGETITIQGKIVEIKNEFTRNRRFIQKGIVEDETGSIQIVWFNQTFLTRLLSLGTMVSLSGKVDVFRKQLALVSPAYEIVHSEESETIHTGRLVPMYPETYGVSSKWLRTKIKTALSLCKDKLIDYVPENLVKKYSLSPFSWAIEHVHFPTTLADAEEARRRLAFDELLILQLRSKLRKKQWEEKRVAHSFSIATYQQQIITFWQHLPFRLTGAQNRAVKELFADLAKTKPMNRLLEGDVGSGKTVVAAIGMYLAFLNKSQSVLMAPTQILAEQHYATISQLLTPLGVKVDLITGGKKPITQILEPRTDIFVGTHALLSEKLQFEHLGFIVIDEQHRFGVEQRASLLAKGQTTPHILTMTATPIPRTVALTMYGNLDLSYLDEMPKGRIEIKTWTVPSQKREKGYIWISEQIDKTEAQVFIICPFIEESETLVTVKAAKKEFEKLKNIVFPKYRVGLLHGRMKAREKQQVMDDFRNRRYDVLVATPVVEVGIDIPGATIILIEGADRFGLAQLHQMRGRVGRSDKQSYCLLFTDAGNHAAYLRLKNLERIHDGARLAQLDLALRGPGELYGTRQHGVPHLKVASFSDATLIEKTKTAAHDLLGSDPNLEKSLLLKQKLKTDTIQRVEPN